jgi:glutathione S-transferase
MATVLPYAKLAGLRLEDYPNVAAWHARLWQLDAWRDPFAGLEAPELPEVPCSATHAADLATNV